MTSRPFIPALALLSACAAPPSGAPAPAAVRPVLALFSHWMAARAEQGGGPDFVLYSNGLTLFWDDSTGRLSSVALAPGQVNALLTALDVPDVLDSLPSVFDRWGPDMTVYRVSYWGPAGLRTVSTQVPMERGQGGRERASSAWLRLHDALMYFHSPRARPWHPDSIEVTLQHWLGSSCDTDIVIVHPWPGMWLAPPQALSPRSGGPVTWTSTALFIESLRAYRRDSLWSNDCQPLVLNNRLWVIDWRIVYPFERYWRSPSTGP